MFLGSPSARPCVCTSVRPHFWLRRYIVYCLGDFRQIYSFGVFGDKVSLCYHIHCIVTAIYSLLVLVLVLVE